MAHDITGYLSKKSLVFTIIKTEDAESEKFPKRQISIVGGKNAQLFDQKFISI